VKSKLENIFVEEIIGYDKVMKKGTGTNAGRIGRPSAEISERKWNLTIIIW
jgi:hypothetical protein